MSGNPLNDSRENPYLHVQSVYKRKGVGYESSGIKGAAGIDIAAGRV